MKKWYLVDVEKYSINIDEIVNSSDFDDRENAIQELKIQWTRYKTSQERKRYIESHKNQDGDYIFSVCLAEYDTDAETIDFDTITDHIDIFDILE